MYNYQKVKNCLAKMLIVIMLASVFVGLNVSDSETFAATAFTATGNVNSSGGAYFRRGPSKSTKIVGLLKNGTKITILKEHFTANSTLLKNRWYYISVGGKKGYIRADLVNGVNNNGARMAWATDSLNVRYAPGKKSALKGYFNKNDAFYAVLTATVNGSNYTWYKIRNGNSFHYVVGSYLTFKKPVGGQNTVTTSRSTPGSSGSATVSQSKASAAVAAGAVSWAISIANDNSFHYGNGNHAHHNGCYFCGTQPTSKKKYVKYWQKTYCCNPFVHAAYAHGGREPVMLKKCKSYGSYDWEYLKTHNKLFAKLGHPPKQSLKKGDVLCYHGHMAMYIGNGKLVEAGHEDDGVRNSRSWNSSISVSNLTDRRYKGFTHVYRYIGKN